MKDKIKKQKGFTLVELLIVVAVIAVLVGIAIPIFNSRLEQSRRAVDKSNAKNIVSALSAGMNSGEIEFTSSTFEGNPTCVAIVVGKEQMTCFVSGSIKIEGESYDNTGGIAQHDRVKHYLENRGINNYTIQSKDSSDDGWAFYVIFLYSDGTIRIGSGTNDDSREYRDDTFESHAGNWKQQGYSNIEKEMNLQ